MGGAEYSLFHLIEHLDKSKFRPVLIVNGTGPLSDRAKSAGAEVFVVPFRTVMLQQLIRPGNFISNFRASFALNELLREQKTDIVQCTDVLSLLLLLPFLVTRRKTLIYSVTFFHERFRAWLLDLLALLFVKRIVYNSIMVRDDTERHTIGLSRMGAVIYNGIDTSDFHPRSVSEKLDLRRKLGFPAEKIIVGFIGRYEVWKGHTVFFDTARKLMAKRNDLVFLMAGGAMTADAIPAVARYRKNVMKRAASFKQPDELILLDHRDDIPDVMASLDVFVCPSESEPYGLVVLEAYASGIPVVASDTVGALEVLANAEGIFVAEAKNAESFSDKIEEAILFRQKSSLPALQSTPLSRYTWEAYARGFEGLYESR